MALLVKDTFSGAGPTALADHEPDFGGPWTDDDAGWIVQGDVLLQNADSPLSQIDLGRKTFRLSMEVNLNSMDSGNVLEIDIGDSSYANEVVIQIEGGGTVRVHADKSGGTVVETNALQTPAKWPASGWHRLDVSAGPSRISASIDGVPIASCFRWFAPSTVISHMALFGGALNGDNSPLIRNLVVTS